MFTTISLSKCFTSYFKGTRLFLFDCKFSLISNIFFQNECAVDKVFIFKLSKFQCLKLMFITTIKPGYLTLYLKTF